MSSISSRNCNRRVVGTTQCNRLRVLFHQRAGYRAAVGCEHQISVIPFAYFGTGVDSCVREHGLDVVRLNEVKSGPTPPPWPNSVWHLLHC